VLAGAVFEKIIVTDSLPPFRLPPDLARDKLVVLDAAALFAAAIQRIHRGGSLVELLDISRASGAQNGERNMMGPRGA
jgi:ribose-phosphate pyrophosphokinase